MTPTTLWLTGLPASGKTTLAQALAERLRADGQGVLVLDGDEVRLQLSSDLGFDDAARDENVRRVAAVALLAAQSSLVTLVALVSPLRAAREAARALHAARGVRFVEVYLSASLEVCEARDPKRLYAKGRSGMTRHVTGLDAPYEAPLTPELEVGAQVSVALAVERVLAFLGA